jgi:hypothetical protein
VEGGEAGGHLVLQAVRNVHVAVGCVWVCVCVCVGVCMVKGAVEKLLKLF